MTNQIPALLPTRDAAWALLNEFTQSPSLSSTPWPSRAASAPTASRKPSASASPAQAAADFTALYSATGLLHDFDYERYPSAQEHPYVGVRVLEERGWPEEIRHAILGHAEYTGTPRISHLDKTLFACDELAGFLTACALVKPTKSIHDVEVAGVKKKLKDKAFARGVNRDDVINGAKELGVDLDQHIAFCLAAMQRDAEALGLAGPQER